MSPNEHNEGERLDPQRDDPWADGKREVDDSGDDVPIDGPRPFPPSPRSSDRMTALALAIAIAIILLSIILKIGDCGPFT